MSLLCRHLREQDREALVLLVTDDGGYSERVQGRPALPTDADDLLTERPSTLAADAKHVLGLFDGEELVAVADVLRGHPSVEYAYVGLLQVAARRHGRGLGRAMHEHLLELVRSWPAVTTLRLAVADPNREQADRFWRRLGYAPTGEVSPWGGTLARSWERPAHRSGRPTRKPAPTTSQPSRDPAAVHVGSRPRRATLGR